MRIKKAYHAVINPMWVCEGTSAAISYIWLSISGPGGHIVEVTASHSLSRRSLYMGNISVQIYCS